MSQATYCTEARELIELCERCTEPDCTSRNGCKAYKALKKKIAQPNTKTVQPAMELEVLKIAPVKLFESTAETLRKCNAAISALEALRDDAACDVLFDSAMICDLLQKLKEIRIREYGEKIDWDAIAERISET